MLAVFHPFSFPWLGRYEYDWRVAAYGTAAGEGHGTVPDGGRMRQLLDTPLRIGDRIAIGTLLWLSISGKCTKAQRNVHLTLFRRPVPQFAFNTRFFAVVALSGW